MYACVAGSPDWEDVGPDDGPDGMAAIPQEYRSLLEQHNGFSNRRVLARFHRADGCITSIFRGGRARIYVYITQSNKEVMQ